MRRFLLSFLVGFSVVGGALAVEQYPAQRGVSFQIGTVPRHRHSGDSDGGGTLQFDALLRDGSTNYGPVAGTTNTHVNLGTLSIAGDSIAGQDRRYATVGGGLTNYAYAEYSTIGGGFSNRMTTGTATAGTIGGGQSNRAGFQATVGGGRNNEARGDNSTIPGGLLNTAEGANAFAAGTQARSVAKGAFTLTDSQLTDLRNDTTDYFLARFQAGWEVRTPTAVYQNRVQAGSFVGDGSGLTSVPNGETNTYNSTKTFNAVVLASATGNNVYSLGTASGVALGGPLRFADGTQLFTAPSGSGELNTYGSSKTFTNNVRIAGVAHIASSTLYMSGTGAAITIDHASNPISLGPNGAISAYGRINSLASASETPGSLGLAIGSDNGFRCAGFNPARCFMDLYNGSGYQTLLGFKANGTVTEFKASSAAVVFDGSGAGLTVSGPSTATYFYGDGSGLTNLPGELNTYGSSKTFTNNVRIAGVAHIASSTLYMSGTGVGITLDHASTPISISPAGGISGYVTFNSLKAVSATAGSYAYALGSDSGFRCSSYNPASCFMDLYNGSGYSTILHFKSTGTYIQGTLGQTVARSCTTGTTTDAAGNFDGCVASSRKAKTRIKDRRANLAAFDRLRVVNYEMKKDKARRTRLGFIAEEVGELYPEAVVPAGADLTGIDALSMSAVLVQEVQDLRRRVKKLEDRQPPTPAKSAGSAAAGAVAGAALAAAALKRKK